MTDQTGRPDDEFRPDGTPGEPSPDAQPDRGDSGPESVLTGFSWDDPSGAGPVRPDGSTASGSSVPQGDEPGYGDGTPSYGSSGDASPAPGSPAQYPPPAPYPPAPGASSDPYGQAPGQSYGQSYGQQQGQQQGQGQGQPYGQQPGSNAPQSAGYGQSAEYTSTPQPYAYGPPPLSPDAEKARSNAILWTILNGVAIFLCGNLLAIPGVILAAIAIGKARVDVQGAQNLTKWSWILFAIGFALGLLLIIAYVVFLIGFVGTAGLSREFSSL